MPNLFSKPGTSYRTHDWESGRDESVADACLSDQLLGPSRIIFAFLPQVPHVDAQVVGERRQQRVPQPLGFHLDQRVLGDRYKMDAFERDRGQRREGVEQRRCSGIMSRRALLGSTTSTPRTRMGALSGR